MRCPQPSPISPLSGEKISFLSRPIRCCNALPLQALLGLFFPFLLFPSFSQRFLSKWKQRWFLPAWVSPLPQDLPTTGSHASNGAGLRPLWCRSPIWLPKSHTGPYTGFSRFCSHSPYLSPTGKGWPVRELGCHGLVDSPTTGSHGSNRAGKPFSWCRFPTLAPKPHTGPHGADFGSHRLFLPPFLGGSPVSWRSR